MWALSRRSGLFIVSYVPLAAMFVALHWPSGWSAAALGKLSAMMLAIAVLLLLFPSVVAVTGRRARPLVALLSLLAVTTVVVGLLGGWLGPMALTVPLHKTTAAVSGVGICFVAAGVLIVALLLYNARRAGAVTWTVTDPRDQGAAVAGYLATYLLPLLGVELGGWRVAVAYIIYIGVLYVVYVSSDSLVLINPTLYLFRYRIYDVETMVGTDPPHPERVLLLTKERIASAMDVEVLPLGDDTYLAR